MEFVASVIGIAAVGVKLSRTLYQIGGRATGARHNINRIATQITLFSSSLKHVGHVLADSKSLHTPEAAETVQQIMDQCERLFEEIARMASGSRTPGDAFSIVAANDRKQRMSILQRIRWSFEQPKCESLLAQLEYLKTTLAIVIQTLSLAALTAKAKQDDPEQAQEIQEERLHVESLVWAQQLSVTVLNEVHAHSDECRQRSPSVTSDDDAASIEAHSPKLLTFGEEVSPDSLITLGGHLDFLDSAIKKKNLQTSEHSINLPSDLVEELLRRWTHKASPSSPRLLEAQVVDVSDAEPAVKVQGSPTATLSPAPEDRSRARSDAVELPDDMRAAGHLLDSNFLTASNTNPELPTELSATPADVENGLSRTISNPEQDLPPRLQITPHTHPTHAGAHVMSPTGDISPSSLHFPLTSPTGNIVSPSTLKYYTSELPTAPACNATAAAAVAASSLASQSSSNYRKPYVSSVRSMTPSVGDSDDENFVDYPKRQENKPARRDSVRSQASTRPRQDSQTASTEGGLDIPWRIRLGPSRYFDFLDARVVGPRTPYKPTERIEWICAQPSARTEISKDWVCEQALGEMRLQFFELSAKELRGSTGQGWVSSEKGGWRVLRALSFSEIESLVERTIDLVKEQYARAPTQQSSPPGPSKSYLRAPPPTSPQNINASLSSSPNNMQHRSASFSDSRDRPGSYMGRDRGFPRYGGDQQPPMNPYELPWMPPRQGQDGRPADRNRDRYHDDRYGYRDRSRGPAPPPEPDYDSGRRRRDRSFEDKKKKRSSKTGTIAKIGALTALLDGIDNVL